MIKRRGESGNVFFTLFGAVALVGVVGVATTTLMRGPLGTVVTLNQRAKVEAQLQIARKLAALEAAQAVTNGTACSTESPVEADFLEPLPPDTVTAGCNGMLGPTTGCLPSNIGSSKLDPWGTNIGYCGWNHGPVTTGCTGLLAGENMRNRTVLAVISAGPDRTFQSSCAAGTYVTKPSGSDDIVFEWTYDEASEGIGNGLWALKSNNPSQITTNKDLDVTSNATFRGANTTFSGAATAFQDDTAFNDQTNFSATADANFASGSSLNLGAGGFFNLPTQVEMPAAQCVAGGTANANRGVLRRNNTSGREALEICNSTGWIRAGSAVAGNVGEIQFNGGSDELGADAAFYWDNTTKRLRLGGAGAPAYTLDLTGTARVTSTLDVGGAFTVADGIASVLGGNTINKGTLDIQGAISNSTGTNPVTITDDVSISGAISDPDSPVNINDSLMVVGRTVLSDQVLAVGTTEITNTLTVTGDFATTLGGSLDVDKAAQAARFITDGANTAALPAFQIGTGGGTGMFSSGANYLNFSTGSAQRLVIEPSGEVGIGVAAPSTALDLYGAIKIGMDSAACPAGAAIAGAVRFSSSGDTLQLCSNNNGWVTIGTSAGGGEGSGSWWQRVGPADPRIYFNTANVGIGTADPQERLHVSGNTRMDGDVLAVGNFNGGDNNIPASGSGTRMFFDSGKAAFRAGQVTGTQWDEANVGDNSAAFGYNVRASASNSFGAGYNIVSNGDGSTAFGRNANATGQTSFAAGETVTAGGSGSFALGSNATASGGDGSFAIGNSVNATGFNSFALGKNVNVSHSGMGIGLIEGWVSPTGANPTVAAHKTLGIFMGDQGGVSLGTERMMGLMGGRLVIDPSQPATDTSPTGTLTVDVKGKVGATHFCDNADDTKCVSALDMANSNVGLFEKAGSVVRGRSPAVNFATDDFVWGAPALDKTVPDDENRMFFDKSAGAFRAGYANGTQWDSTNIGVWSAAFGNNNIASGQTAFAVGQSNTANNNEAIAMGNSSVASGAGAVAIGSNLTASGNSAMAFGRHVTVSHSAMGIGLLEGWVAPVGVKPSVSGHKSLGIFMGDQSGVSIGTERVLALMGGSMIIDPNVPATQTAPSIGLTLDVEGKVGAQQYCDATGANCVNPGSGGGWVDRFTELADVPNAYTGHGQKIVAVNSGATGLGFGDVYYDSGKLGIGVAIVPATSTRLDVAGTIKIGNGGETCGGTYAGAIRYNSPNLEICNGTAWKKAGSPGGSDKQVQYNSTGDFAGDAGLTYDPTGLVKILAVAGNIRYLGTLTDYSDKRMKGGITPLNERGSMLDKIGNVKTYTYYMLGDETKKTEYGVMAQELEPIFPELVDTDDSELAIKTVNYVGLIAPMIEAMKELKAENDNLKIRLASVETDIKGMKAHTGYGIDKASFADRSVIFAALGAIVLSSFFFMMGMFFRRKS